MTSPRRAMLLALLTALLLGGAPAGAAPRPAISDGFTARGRGGAQALVRVTRDVVLPEPYSNGRATTLRASTGGLAGYAFLSARTRQLVAHVVGTDPVWTCGEADCGRGARLFDAHGGDLRDNRRVLPKGDYVLVLIGAPDATVEVTLPPLAKGARTVRVPVQRALAPVVDDTITPVPRAGVEPAALGEYNPTRTRHRAVFGIVHAVSWVGDGGADFTLRLGTRAWDTRCYSGWYSGVRSGGDLVFGPWESYRAMAIVGTSSPKETGTLCAQWEGVVDGALPTQRAIGFYVPVVL